MAEDAAQATFERAWAGLATFSGERLGGWLRSIAINTSRSLRRSEDRRKPREEGFAFAEGTTSPAAEDDALREVLARSIRSDLTNLSERDRWILWEHHAEGVPVTALADATGLTENSMKVALARARRRAAITLGALRALAVTPLVWMRSRLPRHETGLSVMAAGAPAVDGALVALIGLILLVPTTSNANDEPVLDVTIQTSPDRPRAIAAAFPTVRLPLGAQGSSPEQVLLNGDLRGEQPPGARSLPPVPLPAAGVVLGGPAPEDGPQWSVGVMATLPGGDEAGLVLSHWHEPDDGDVHFQNACTELEQISLSTVTCAKPDS